MTKIILSLLGLVGMLLAAGWLMLSSRFAAVADDSTRAATEDFRARQDRHSPLPRRQRTRIAPAFATRDA